MQLPKLIRGRFLKRDNRFRATVTVDGQEAWAHVPNSGRLADLFTSNRPVWLAPTDAPYRKTAYDLKLVEFDSGLVSVDARLPNPLFAEAVKGGHVSGFRFPVVEQEVSCGDSRLDFRLSGPEEICWVETKSVTLVRDGVALFPDVPTKRGSRHLRALVDVHSSGDRVAVVFIIQRPDACCLMPYERADPVFAATLREAVAAGVEARALTCQVSLGEITIAGEVPVFI